MPGTVTVDTYFDIKTKRINILRGQNIEFLISKRLAPLRFKGLISRETLNFSNCNSVVK